MNFELSLLFRGELLIDVKVTDALHDAVSRVPRHFVAVTLLREGSGGVSINCFPCPNAQSFAKSQGEGLGNYTYSV